MEQFSIIALFALAYLFIGTIVCGFATSSIDNDDKSKSLTHGEKIQFTIIWPLLIVGFVVLYIGDLIVKLVNLFAFIFPPYRKKQK